MIIITKEGKTREENKQLIIVKETDKYGIAMLAYFKNSLNGQNVQKLAVKDKNQVQLHYNWKEKTYTLQILKFSIADDSILRNYATFKRNYKKMIKDKICQMGNIKKELR